MKDEMRAREKAICEAAGIKDIGDLSDGFHTFNQLYYQRMILFATIVKQNRDKAWKSLRHEDGELCFGGGWFIVGIDTPEGSYTYHYEDNYYSLFDCAELECGKHWDGHTEKDVTRLLSLSELEKQERDRWHSVAKEGNPKESGLYIVIDNSKMDGNEPHTRYFNAYGKKAFWSGWRADEVIAWKEITSEPYTEEDND